MIPIKKYIARGIETTNDQGDSSVAHLGVTKNGNDKVSVCFEIVEGEHAGSKVWWTGFFTERTEDRTIDSLRYMGMQGNDPSKLAQENLTDEVEIDVGHDEYEGKTSARVNWVNKIGRGTVSTKGKMTPEDERTFAARMTAKFAARPSDKPKGDGVPF